MAEKPKPDARAAGEGPTVRPVRAAVVIIASGPDELVEAARKIAAAESPTITVEACSAASLTSLAASMRPFAIVLTKDIYAFDPDEFAALARDVSAELVVLKLDRMTPAFIEQALRPSLRTAFRRFRSETESGPVRKG